MTKEEYIAKETEIKDKIQSLQEELKRVREEYARSNMQIPAGTKVKTDRGAFGIYMGNRLEFGKLRPILLKLKKDGSVSKQEIPWYRFDTFEPIE